MLPQLHDPDIYIDPHFLERNPMAQAMGDLFNFLPNVVFFAKDRESRFMAANPAMLAAQGLVSGNEIFGKTDYDFYPPALAAIHVKQDRQLFETGEGLSRGLWFEINQTGEIVWYSSSKLPLKAHDGYIFGVVGTRYLLVDRKEKINTFGSLLPAIEYLEEHFTDPVSIDKMGALTGMSSYQFNVTFLDLLDMPLHQFVHCLRMDHARHLLGYSDLPIVEVSKQSGFDTEEDFERHFERWNGLDSSEFRCRFNGAKAETCVPVSY